MAVSSNPGVFFRANGNLYFVPAGDLENYLLKDHNVEDIKDELNRRGITAARSNVLGVEGASLVRPIPPGPCCAINKESLLVALGEEPEKAG